MACVVAMVIVLSCSFEGVPRSKRAVAARFGADMHRGVDEVRERIVVLNNVH